MMKKIRILNKISTSFIDYPDNESIALCVVMMGCTNGCLGCQNPSFMNPLYDVCTREVSVDELVKELEILCENNKTNKIILSGGDPISVYNIDFTKSLLKFNNKFDFCIYSGHNIDYVMENNITGFKFIKCGKFDVASKRPSYKDDFRMIFASPNQILYNDKCEPISIDGIYNFN